MAEYSEKVVNALASDCAHSMEPLMQAKDKQDFASLLKVLEDEENPQAQARALWALGRWGDSKAVAPIRRTLSTFDEVGRLSAADALSRLNTPAALDAVLELSEDPSPHVRKSVLKALTRFDKPKALKGFDKIRSSEREDFVKQYAGKLQAVMEK